jgi:hypothetical protein
LCQCKSGPKVHARALPILLADLGGKNEINPKTIDARNAWVNFKGLTQGFNVCQKDKNIFINLVIDSFNQESYFNILSFELFNDIKY